MYPIMSKKKLKLLSIISLLVLFMCASCNKIDQKDFELAEQQNIDNYLEANPTIPFQQKESGLYYYEITAGTGQAAAAHDTVCVIYTGKFLGGYIFDSNVGKDTFSFPVGEDYVIPGFEEAISYMKPGGKSVCLIPSKLAYGPGGWPPYIPGYAPLVYEINLTKVLRTAR